MFSVPGEYTRLIVRPSVDRFLAEPTAYDLGFAACIFLFHFCDVYAEHNSMTSEEARQRIAAVNPIIDVVHAVCIAAKHVRVRNARLGLYRGLMAEHAHIGKAAAFSDGTYFSDGTSFSDRDDVVRVQTPDGAWHDFTFLVSSLTKTIEDHFV